MDGPLGAVLHEAAKLTHFRDPSPPVYPAPQSFGNYLTSTLKSFDPRTPSGAFNLAMALWYHGTSEAGAAQIAREGFIRPTAGMGRATDTAHAFVTRDPKLAAQHGPVVIPVREQDIPWRASARPLSDLNVAASRGRIPVDVDTLVRILRGRT